MFETIIQGQGSGRAGGKRTVLVSFAVHVLVLGILIVIPLMYYQTIPGGWEVITEVFGVPDIAPPAPPPQVRPSSGVRPRATETVVIRVPDLVEPGHVPEPPDAREIELTLDQIGTAIGPCCQSEPFVPDAALSGQMVSNLLPKTGPKTPPPPPPKPPKQPMLISTLDPSRLIYRVEPVYPQLAIASRVQGSVLLQVTVSEMGTVDAVEVMSGHPLLVKAAVETVRQWRYKPTILNGEPVPVKATVTVNFNLHR